MLKKQDFILMLIVFLAAAVLFAGYRFRNRGKGEEVVVYLGEEELVRFSLKEDTEYEITLKNGESNRLMIKDGKADVTEASCPDQICVHQAAISQTGETIVCMPHKLVVTIEQAAQRAETNKR